MGNKTPLYQQHLAAGAKIVDFSGWDMPLHYGSQIAEHHQVRRDAGMFDVSHMAVTDFIGPETKAYLRHLLANDVAKITIGKALYSCMLNLQGGVIDDLIVYQLDENHYRIISNAGTRDKDLAWFQEQAKAYKTEIKPRSDLAIIAIQGPNAVSKTLAALTPKSAAASSALKPFQAALVNDWLIARTGYTGEDGFEIVLPVAAAQNFWQSLLNQAIKPCGLGARDTLRLEAGLNLYGADMDENISPLEANLAWTVAWSPPERNFIGRQALEKQRQTGLQKQLLGLILEEQGILRNHQLLFNDGESIGEITSGSFSPTLNISIALARLNVPLSESCFVEMRGKRLPVKIVQPPFVRFGKKVYNIQAKEKIEQK